MKSVEIEIQGKRHTLTTKDRLQTIEKVLTAEQVKIAIKKAERMREERARQDPTFLLVNMLRENLPFSEESKVVRMIVEGLLCKTEISYTELLQEKL